MQHDEIHHDSSNPEHDHDKQDEHQEDDEQEMLSEQEQRSIGENGGKLVEDEELKVADPKEQDSVVDGVVVEESETDEESSDTDDDVGVKEIVETPEMVKLRDSLGEIRGKMLTMKWDYEHDQINAAKKSYYEKLKKEYDELEFALRRELEKQK
ncbi:MAG: hypothetical protein AABX52_04100 [Nanoarchaeota archaeon]